jgi:hypothetical protein
MSPKSTGGKLALAAGCTTAAIAVGLWQVARDKRSAADFGLATAAGLVNVATKFKDFMDDVADNLEDAK